MLLPRPTTGRGARIKVAASLPYSRLLDGHEQPASIWINMFRQAKVLDNECPSERGRQCVVRNSRLTVPPASTAEIQSMSMAVSPGDVYRCRDKLVTRGILGETIIVPVSGELAGLQNAYVLNMTGAFVWERLDGSTSLEIIHQALTRNFEIGEKDAWKDLEELVADLAQAGLIERESRTA